MVPTQTSAPGATLSPIYGRAAELEQLRRVVVASHLAIGQFVTLGGVAGSGKTTLLEWFRLRAPGTVLHAKGEAHDAEVPFNILKRMLSAWVSGLRQVPDQSATWGLRPSESLGSDGRLLVPIFPDLGRMSKAFKCSRG